MRWTKQHENISIMPRNPLRKEIRDHYQRVADLGCCVTRQPICVLHHCFGGSLVSVFGLKSMSDRGISDWLVIPLHPSLHTSGPDAFHSLGIYTWERKFGEQMSHLHWVNEQLEYNIFDKAEEEIKC